MKNTQQKTGFTLAEVLITLGIIGVVAAMTLPTLIAKNQERVLVTRAKKSYTSILNAFNLYKAENQVFDLTTLFDTSNTSRQTLDTFSKYFKAIEICNSGKGCQGTYKIKKTKPTPDGNGGKAMLRISDKPRIVLADGSIIAIQQYPNCHQTYDTGLNIQYDENGMALDQGQPWTRNYCASICFDTNGKEKPNQAGRDYFCFGVRANGSIYDHNTINTGSITSVLATDKLNNTVDYSEGSWKN